MGWPRAGEDEGAQLRVRTLPRCKPGRGRRMKRAGSPWAASGAAAAAGRGLGFCLPRGQEGQSLPGGCAAQHPPQMRVNKTVFNYLIYERTSPVQLKGAVNRECVCAIWRGRRLSSSPPNLRLECHGLGVQFGSLHFSF